jgi:hypothetical protein
MKYTIQVVITTDEGQTETREIASVKRENLTATTFGLPLAEGKPPPQGPATGRGRAADDGIYEDATSLCPLQQPARP